LSNGRAQKRGGSEGLRQYGGKVNFTNPAWVSGGGKRRRRGAARDRKGNIVSTLRPGRESLWKTEAAQKSPLRNWWGKQLDQKHCSGTAMRSLTRFMGNEKASVHEFADAKFHEEEA